MSRWFRYYDEALDDPKVQKLDGDTFKGWVNLLCLASRHGGKLPAIADIAFALRTTEDGARTLVERLLNGGLIDKASGGADGYTYAPHSWAKRQYKSDTSNERVKRYRQRFKTVTETAPETEAETDNTVPKGTGAGAPFDPSKLMFDSGVALIVQAGKSEAQARAWLGKAKRDFGEEAVIAAISRAKREGAIEPIAFMQGCLRHKSRVEEEYTGP
jgi:hypothetical protein